MSVIWLHTRVTGAKAMFPSICFRSFVPRFGLCRLRSIRSTEHISLTGRETLPPKDLPPLVEEPSWARPGLARSRHVLASAQRLLARRLPGPTLPLGPGRTALVRSTSSGSVRTCSPVRSPPRGSERCAENPLNVSVTFKAGCWRPRFHSSAVLARDRSSGCPDSRRRP